MFKSRDRLCVKMFESHSRNNSTGTKASMTIPLYDPRVTLPLEEAPMSHDWRIAKVTTHTSQHIDPVGKGNITFQPQRRHAASTEDCIAANLRSKQKLSHREQWQ